MRRRKRYDTVRAPLPVEQWNDEASVFRFGLPSGWHCSHLALAHEPGTVVLTGVTNWRTGDPRVGEVPATARPYLCMFVLEMPSLTGREAVREFEQILADPDGLAQHRAESGGRRPMGRPARILLDQNPAVLLQSTAWDYAYGCGSDKLDIGRSEVFTLAPGGHPLLATYQGMLGLQQQCMPEFFTMLGTWEWRPS
jgi:hypothetical protein